MSSASGIHGVKSGSAASAFGLAGRKRKAAPGKSFRVKGNMSATPGFDGELRLDSTAGFIAESRAQLPVGEEALDRGP